MVRYKQMTEGAFVSVNSEEGEDREEVLVDSLLGGSGVDGEMIVRVDAPLHLK